MAVSPTDRRTQAELIRESREAVLGGLERENTLGSAGDRAVINIVTRTKAGIDRHGNKFAEYAESTKRKKRKKRQRIRPPTLTDTEQMLNDMSVTQVNGYWGEDLIVAEVGFTTRRSENIARFHIGGTVNMPERDFAGLTPQDEEDFNEFIGAETRRFVPSDRRRRVRIQVIKL